VSGGPQRSGRVLAAGLLIVCLAATLGPGAPLAVAAVGDSSPSSSMTNPSAAPTAPAPPAEVSERTSVIGTAAAAGAGSAADEVLAEAAERAARAAAETATTALPPAKPVLKPVHVAAVVPPGSPSRWSGWQSGAAGSEAEDGTFATWRGKPLGIVSVWSDTDAETQTQLDAVGAYAGFKGEMDVAVGALVSGETWEQAAAGAYVNRWTTAIRNLRAKRAGKGTTYIRIGHEFNGDWFAWGVNAKNAAAYKQGYRLYASIVRKEFPQAKLNWSPNGGNHTDVSIDSLYPGSDVVDVIGPDIYDGYPPTTSDAVWRRDLNSWLAPGSPTGLGAWQQYAASKHKPLGLGEWGLQAGDHPSFIKGMHDFMAKYAAPKGSQSVAGRFVYDCYFNAEAKFKIYNGSNPGAGQMYASLAWGN
jgi:hypothetical protein